MAIQKIMSHLFGIIIHTEGGHPAVNFFLQPEFKVVLDAQLMQLKKDGTDAKRLLK